MIGEECQYLVNEKQTRTNSSDGASNLCLRFLSSSHEHPIRICDQCGRFVFGFGPLVPFFVKTSLVSDQIRPCPCLFPRPCNAKIKSEDGVRRPSSCYQMKSEDGVRRPSSCYQMKYVSIELSSLTLQGLTKGRRKIAGNFK